MEYGDANTDIEQVTNEAIARAGRGANAEWQKTAVREFIRIAKENAEFPSEVVWETVQKPREPRALGFVVRDILIPAGVVTMTDQVVKSRYKTQHGNIVRVLKSNIYRPQPVA